MEGGRGWTRSDAAPAACAGSCAFGPEASKTMRARGTFGSMGREREGGGERTCRSQRSTRSLSESTNRALLCLPCRLYLIECNGEAQGQSGESVGVGDASPTVLGRNTAALEQGNTLICRRRSPPALAWTRLRTRVEVSRAGLCANCQSAPALACLLQLHSPRGSLQLPNQHHARCRRCLRRRCLRRRKRCRQCRSSCHPRRHCSCYRRRCLLGLGCIPC